MCRFCERPCFRDGGEADCELSDAEYQEAADGPDDVFDIDDEFDRWLTVNEDDPTMEGWTP